MLKFIVEPRRWHDKVNGNTYHSVTILNPKGKLLYSSGRVYGYGEQYKETAKEWLMKHGYLKESDRFNFDLLRNLIYYAPIVDVNKRDLGEQFDSKEKPKRMRR